MPKWMRIMGCAALVVFVAGRSFGCGDDVKTVTTHEEKRESEPEMVSPGEMVVE
jgi:hypothetical protein